MLKPSIQHRLCTSLVYDRPGIPGGNSTGQRSLVPSRAWRDEEIFMSRKFVIAGLLTGAMVLSACNTVRGAKADVNSAGKTVEKATDGK